MIELSNKINSSTDELIKSFITEDWKTFCSDKIQNWANLFSRKLCYEEKNNNFFNNYFDNYYESNNGKTAESEQTSNETKEADEANKENNLVEIVNFVFIIDANNSDKLMILSFKKTIIKYITDP